MKTVRELAQSVEPFRVKVTGSIRRMAIALTARTLWQLVGHRVGTQTETIQAETFSGIGFYARPPSTGKPEAIVLMVGDASAPVVVAVRDEKTRAAIAGALAEDESAVFNTKAIVHVKADGTIEARSASGVAKSLATKDDIDALKSWALTHTHPAPGGATSAPTDPPPDADGTNVLKGE